MSEVRASSLRGLISRSSTGSESSLEACSSDAIVDAAIVRGESRTIQVAYSAP